MPATKKFVGCLAAVAIAAVVNSAAFADDTELLLTHPNNATPPKPNVLFILDSSGSMQTRQETREPYNGQQQYPGDCDPAILYWTTVDVTPDCGTSSYTISKRNFQCASASRQLQGSGSYTDTMAQYRKGGNVDTSTGAARWQYLAAENANAPVECRGDFGIHGDGRARHLWPSSLAEIADPYTANENNAISWGSAPRNLSYTVYDGNYLNWKNSPIDSVQSRSAIMKEVIKTMLNSVDNMNVGLMHFDAGDGGAVILDIADLNSNRTAVLDAIDRIPASGVSPLSETLFESALYWRGLPAKFGAANNSELTDPDALTAANSSIYEPPMLDACSKNYNIILTDGAPVKDDDTPELMSDLPGISSVLGYSGCDGSGTGMCLDDIAEYLANDDIDTNLEGKQAVTTHTIGFVVDLPLLKETARKSGGRYFLADDVASLTKSMQSIIGDINDRSQSFAAPTVAVNSFNRTQNLGDVYITTFGVESKAHWPGNLKKYRLANRSIVDLHNNAAIDPDTGYFRESAHSIWTKGDADGNDVRRGGAAQLLPSPQDRNLYSNYVSGDLSADNNAIHNGNMALVSGDFGLTGAQGEPELAELLDWARGVDIGDADNAASTGVRNSMGDPLHSQPAAIIYGGAAENPETVVFTATNDGYLHAIAGDDGKELWAFIPKQLLQNTTRLYFDPAAKYKQYGIDGNIVPIVKDLDRDGRIEPDDGDYAYIVFGMRRGGQTYFALDVTVKDKPKLLWTFDNPDGSESWSTPTVSRIAISGATQNTDHAVVVIGGGYDTVHDTAMHPPVADASGAGIHILDLKSGALLWRAGMDSAADLQLDLSGRSMNRAIPNQVQVIDLNTDGFADRMYASDLGGQIWRFDIYNDRSAGELISGGVIAQFGAEGLGGAAASDTRRFYNAPDVSLITDVRQQRRYVAISIGSGYRAHPFDLTASDQFFSVRDPNVFNSLDQQAFDNLDIIGAQDLIEVNGKIRTIIGADDHGWRFSLPPNEKVLTDSLTFDDQVFFVSFSPDADAAANCSSGAGRNFLYRMNIVNGDPVIPNVDSLDPWLADLQRRDTLRQGGIAPSPAILFPGPETDCDSGDCSQAPLGCVGLECFEPGFDSFPVRTLWTQDSIK